MTEEKRKEIAKYAKGLLEDAKVSVRNARQDTLKKIKANDELTEDEQKDLESDIQDDVNKANKSLEEIFTKKEQDIMKV
jgi:ribosome recycling factor